MKPVGRIAITGTIGYDLSYIRLVPTPTGRKIRFVTNRLVRFGDAYSTMAKSQQASISRMIRLSMSSLCRRLMNTGRIFTARKVAFIRHGA
jgi:hypothetical protein